MKTQKKIISFFLLSAICFLLLNPETSFAFESVKLAIRELCLNIEGPLGALLLTTVGIGALASAAMGNTRAAASAFIVAIGCYATNTILSFYFPGAAQICEQGVGAAETATGGAANANPGGIPDGGPLDRVGGGFNNPGGDADGGPLRAFSGAEVQRALREVGAIKQPGASLNSLPQEERHSAFVESLEADKDDIEGF